MRDKRDDAHRSTAHRAQQTMGPIPEEAQASYRAEFEVITKRIRELGIEPQ